MGVGVRAGDHVHRHVVTIVVEEHHDSGVQLLGGQIKDGKGVSGVAHGLRGGDIVDNSPDQHDGRRGSGGGGPQ